MARADSHNTTNLSLPGTACSRLSTLIADPFVREAFEAAERDSGDDFAMAEFDHLRTLDGGAAEVITTTGRQVLALVGV